MHHFKSPFLQMQDIFVAKQHIFSKPSFQGFKWVFSESELVIQCLKFALIFGMVTNFPDLPSLLGGAGLRALKSRHIYRTPSWVGPALIDGRPLGGFGPSLGKSAFSMAVVLQR